MKLFIYDHIAPYGHGGMVVIAQTRKDAKRIIIDNAYKIAKAWATQGFSPSIKPRIDESDLPKSFELKVAIKVSDSQKPGVIWQQYDQC